MRMILPAFILLLTGCATAVDTGYVVQMNSLVGADEGTLIARMGVPDRSYVVDSAHKALAYTTVRERYVDGGGIGICGGSYGHPFGYSACRNDFPRRIVNDSCEVTFLIGGDRVTAWQQRGNACPRIR